MKFLIRFFKKIVLASILIYSFDTFGVSLDVIIPINVFTIFLVAFFDIPAMLCLILFFITF